MQCPHLLTGLFHQSLRLHSLQGLQRSPERYVHLLLGSTSGAQQLMPLRGQALALPHQVLQFSLRFSSQCEHHMLPFHGTARVALVDARHRTDEAVIRQAVEMFSWRLQIQERLTQQIADAVQHVAESAGVMVVCEAAHMCMVARGVEKHASSTITLATRGQAATDPALRRELLLQLTRL